MGHTARRQPVLVLVLAVLIGAFAWFGSGADAQTPTTTCQPDDPYGCVSTTQSQTFSPTISIDPSTGPAGTSVLVEACGYDPAQAGATGSITFNGEAVGTATLGGDGCIVDTRIDVPGVPPGDYQVCSVFAGYPTPCATFTVTEGDSSVLGGGAERGGGGAGGGGTGGGGDAGGGSLARTGTSILAFLLAAAVLIASGRLLLARSRRPA